MDFINCDRPLYLLRGTTTTTVLPGLYVECIFYLMMHRSSIFRSAVGVMARFQVHGHHGATNCSWSIAIKIVTSET